MISNAHAQAAGGPPPGGEAFSWIFLLGMLVIFWLFLIYPQMKRQKEHRKMVEALSKGDEAVTNGGLLGKIVEVGENFILLEVDKDTNVKVQKHMIAAVMPKGTIKAL